ncbi:MAG TPA: SH3 domain-containing protein [Burkholderiales bacterium]|nr:SH3 domain-containing protein [Burkholderiales bacterium]
MRPLLLMPALVALFASAPAMAQFRSVEENAAILYDAPSRAATRVSVVSRHYPLEVITTLGAWIKVRDHTGALAWIETKSLGERHMVLATAAATEVRQRPDDAAPVAFIALQNVVLERIDGASGGWLRVRAADGAEGYVRASQVWGS